jgi:hypothetical protein
LVASIISPSHVRVWPTYAPHRMHLSYISASKNLARSDGIEPPPCMGLESSRSPRPTPACRATSASGVLSCPRWPTFSFRNPDFSQSARPSQAWDCFTAHRRACPSTAGITPSRSRPPSTARVAIRLRGGTRTLKTVKLSACTGLSFPRHSPEPPALAFHQIAHKPVVRRLAPNLVHIVQPLQKRRTRLEWLVRKITQLASPESTMVGTRNVFTHFARIFIAFHSSVMPVASS